MGAGGVLVPCLRPHLRKDLWERALRLIDEVGRILSRRSTVKWISYFFERGCVCSRRLHD